jgi:hypothetical protein
MLLSIALSPLVLSGKPLVNVLLSLALSKPI